MFAVAGCDQAEGLGHEHTFKDKWNYNETLHWQEASCDHTEYTKNLGEHDFDEDGYCTTCGALMINGHLIPQSVGEGDYPYILKGYDENGELVTNSTYSEGGKVMTQVFWNALEQINEYFVTVYNDDGKEIKSYNYDEGSEATKDRSYEYNEKGLLVKEYNSLDLTDTQIIYTYDSQGRVTRKSWQEGNPLTEYRYEITTYYDDYAIIQYSKDKYNPRLITDKVVYSTEGNLRVESFFRSYIPDEGDPVDYYPIGVVKYDTNNNVVYAKDMNRDGSYELDEVTYTDAGEIKTVVNSDEGGYAYKTVYNYNEKGFLDSSDSYYYDGADFTNKYVEYKYWCDSKGTVIALKYTHYDNGVVDQELFRYYQIIYTNFKSDCMYDGHAVPYYGAYTATEKSFLAIIG